MRNLRASFRTASIRGVRWPNWVKLRWRGDWANAARHLQEARSFLTRAEGNLYTGIFVAMTHTDLAELALVHNDPTQARQELAQALPYARHYLRRLHCLLVTLVGLMVTSSPSATVPAVTLLGALAGLESRTGDTLSPFHQRLWQAPVLLASVLL